MYFQGWRRYFDFVGVSTRTEYWTFTLVNYAIAGLLILGFTFSAASIDTQASTSSTISRFAAAGFGYVLIAFGLLAIIPSLSVTVRRIRDSIGSGWWILIALLPFVGGIVILTMTLMSSKER